MISMTIFRFFHEIESFTQEYFRLFSLQKKKSNEKESREKKTLKESSKNVNRKEKKLFPRRIEWVFFWAIRCYLCCVK